MKPLRILYFTTIKFLPALSGGEKGIAYFLEALGKFAEVTCVATHNNVMEKPLTYKMQKVFRDVKWKYFNPKVVSEVIRLYKESKSEAIIVDQPFMALPIWWLSKVCRFPVFVNSCNIEFLRFKSIGKWWWIFIYIFERIAYRSATKVLFVSVDDVDLAIKHFGISREKCFAPTYGVQASSIPKPRPDLRTELAIKHKLQPNEKVFIFFGMLSYEPNLEAVDIIIDEIAPLLKQKADFLYRIFICGGGLPKNYSKLENAKSLNIEFVGFVKEIESYILTSDVMLNPMLSGGGVKTKVLESLALNKSVISTQQGALGLILKACGNKISVVDDANWTAFTEKAISLAQNSELQTPNSFYETYFWENIAKNSLQSIRKTLKT
ncbi:MAG: glycosyltransferase involved in cell wall biosynthesis [Arenicella sp.]|jgi:glycosyltransferase involved in cell wall biosynthesis